MRNVAFVRIIWVNNFFSCFPKLVQSKANSQWKTSLYITEFYDVQFLRKWAESRDVYQPVFTCSKLTRETLEQGVKYVQS